MADARGRVLLHRLIVSEYLGRPLTPYEIVHHKDEDKSNNLISNLEVLDRSSHSKEHGKSKTRTVETRVCQACNKSFSREKRYFHENSKYCSRSCSVKMQPPTTIHPLLIAKIKKLREVGNSSYSIAVEVGVSRTTVIKYWK
jgi:hypothetical protein